MLLQQLKEALIAPTYNHDVCVFFINKSRKVCMMRLVFT
jgi:hypothetical protein